MKIDATVNGTAVTLSKRELDALQKAKSICGVIERHSLDDGDAAKAIDAIDAMLARIVPPESDPLA